MRAEKRKVRETVVEGSWPPGIFVVALGAGVRKIARDMVRVSCSVEIDLMARETIPGRTLENVVGVTAITPNRGVSTDERKEAVIHCRGAPTLQGVAPTTIGRVAQDPMVWVTRVAVVLLMAGKAHR